MQPWAQRNVVNWVRRLGSEWTIHVLDAVPGSPTNVKHLVEETYFPDAFNDGRMDGPFVGPHMGDLVRLPLLWKYGGVWMDVGTMLFRDLDDICWDKITDPASPYELGGYCVDFRQDYASMINGFLACQSGNPFIKRWHDIYLSLWKHETTNSVGFHKLPLLSHVRPIEVPKDRPIDDIEKITPLEEMLDYLAHFLCFERLRCLSDPSDGFNGCDYFHEKVFLLPAMSELFGLQPRTGWDGREQLKLLQIPLDGPQDEMWQTAMDYAKDAFANQTAMKASRGPKNPKMECLAELWDMPEYRDADYREGTFAAWLRYGSVHYAQTRKVESVKLPRTEEVLALKLLEPKGE